VDSAIVEIQFDPGRSGPHLEAVLATCRRLFPYRRKTLRAALRTAFKGTVGTAQADQFAQRFGPDRRLETMTPGGFVELRRVLAEAGVEPLG
jgi:16S rRNA A1518/A1519 N6-dimethyltransferase RsmA/KsgA/DIM1 with predicted DNA glycosylase/AP lyase activity